MKITVLFLIGILCLLSSAPTLADLTIIDDVNRDSSVDIYDAAVTRAPSYIISTVTIGATTYYSMQNSTTGKLDYYSTNATQVFQFTLGNCPKGKGIIVKKANYSDIHIIWDDGWDNITLVGEDGALLCQNTNTTDIITLRGSKADPLENLAISGFHFQGCNQAGSQCGIHMANTRNCIIENNYFDGMASARYTGHVAAIYLEQNCNNNRISGNTIYQGTCEGIGIGGAR